MEVGVEAEVEVVAERGTDSRSRWSRERLPLRPPVGRPLASGTGPWRRQSEAPKHDARGTMHKCHHCWPLSRNQFTQRRSSPSPAPIAHHHAPSPQRSKRQYSSPSLASGRGREVSNYCSCTAHASCQSNTVRQEARNGAIVQRTIPPNGGIGQ